MILNGATNSVSLSRALRAIIAARVRLQRCCARRRRKRCENDGASHEGGLEVA